MSLIKIREISARYDITARTLRYYEDMGLLASSRSEDYAYRLYDEAAVKRLEQILVLRRLNISIRDIQRIFSAPGSEVVLEVLHQKAADIDKEVALLQQLKEIVLEFIHQMEQADFGRDSDVKLLYEKAQTIKTQLKKADYQGKPTAVNRLLAVTEQLPAKVPDIMVVNIAPFWAVTSGRMGFEELMGGDFEPWQEAHDHLFTPILFDAPDLLCGNGEMAEWFWAVRDGVTEADTHPYHLVKHPGGLYAVAVSMDGDGESYDHVQRKMEAWLQNTGFVRDDSRWMAGNMMYARDEAIQKGLGYQQMDLYMPIRLREEDGQTPAQHKKR